MKLIQDRYLNFYNLEKLFKIQVENCYCYDTKKKKTSYIVTAHFNGDDVDIASLSKPYESEKEALDRMAKIIEAIELATSTPDYKTLTYGDY